MYITPLVIVTFFIAFDVLTGWLKAAKTGTWNSSIMRNGLYHKIGEILSVGFGYVCELAFPYIGVSIDVPIAAGIVTYIAIMETLSIVENLCALSPDMAAFLSKVFDKEKLTGLEEKVGKHENKSGNSK